MFLLCFMCIMSNVINFAHYMHLCSSNASSALHSLLVQKYHWHSDCIKLQPSMQADASVVQLLEHWSHDAKVEGSNPVFPLLFSCQKYIRALWWMLILHFSPDAFLSDLRQELLVVTSDADDVDVDIYWSRIKKAIETICNRHAPLKKA